MAYIRRFLENQILELREKYPVIMITGARQVGKTTILRHIADNTRKKINFVTLDDLNERTLAINDPKFFIETHKFPLIIDEFQYAPNLLSYITFAIFTGFLAYSLAFDLLKYFGKTEQSPSSE